MQALESLATRVLFGIGEIEKLGEVAHGMGFRRTLIVSDRGIVAAGYFDRAVILLEAAGIEAAGFHDFTENPDTVAIEAGRAFAGSRKVDSLVGLGGGSSMDCAKGINFLITNGGRMEDYWGYAKASRPMFPMLAVPTTAGTGSDAQSYALISNAETHVKMACGDPGAAFKLAILDPELTRTQPRKVRAAAGYDAISHVVETWVTTKRSVASDEFSREAASLLLGSFERVLEHPDDVSANGDMLLGAFYAGAAIEQSMLGAAHASANPITARYGTEHGAAIAHMLPHVVRWNGKVCAARYADLAETIGLRSASNRPADALAEKLEELATAGGLPTRLRDAGVGHEDLPELAADAAKQWTGRCNPRPFDAAGALEVYECAY